jgi:hypothetical protein
MAESAAAKSTQAPRRSGGLALKLAMVALAGAALSALPLCLLIVPGMMPSLAVLFVDRQRPRYLSYSVAVMNFAGVLPFLLALATSGMSLAAAAHKLSDPFTWLVMYGAAAVGWFTCAATPPLARICIEIQAGQRRRTLEALAKAMRQEWGEEVTGKAQPK